MRRLLPDWDRAGTQHLDRQAVEVLAYSIRGPLHSSTGIRSCGPPGPLCAMCGNAARLAYQHLEPRLRRRFVEQVQDAMNVHCTLHHTGGDL